MTRYRLNLQILLFDLELFLVSSCFVVGCISVSLQFRVGLEGFAAVWTRNLAWFYSSHWYVLR